MTLPFVIGFDDHGCGKAESWSIPPGFPAHLVLRDHLLGAVLGGVRVGGLGGPLGSEFFKL